MVEGSWRYESQFGIGAAAPTQKSWVSAAVSPVADWAAAARLAGIGLRNSPIPPRRVSAGGPCAEVPGVRVNRARGQKWDSRGRRSGRLGKRCATIGLDAVAVRC